MSGGTRGSFELRPMSPRRVRHGIKLRGSDGDTARTWVAQRWMAVLEQAIGPQQRLSGLEYARSGQAITCELGAGGVFGSVAAGMIPAALEILDQATIRAVEASVYRAGYPQDAAAVLLVELDGPGAMVEIEADAVNTLFLRNGALSSEEATDPAERERLWKGRKGAFGAMGRLKPDLYVLDGVVPRTRLVDSLTKITAIGQKYGLTLTNVFHAGDGNLHPNISFDGRDEDETARVLAAGFEILELCVAAGGSITGEHGIGSEKLDHVPLMFTKSDLEVMERVRRAWNPRGLCNPGKVIPERSACAEVAKWPAMIERIRKAEDGADR